MTGLTVLAEAPWLTGPRIRRIALIFTCVALIVLGADTWLHTRAGVTDVHGEQLGRDFINYWSGAHLAMEGHARRVYDINAFLAWERSRTAANAEFKWYSYPPVMLLLSLPLAALGLKSGLLAWLLAGWLACARLLTRLMNWRTAILAAFAAPASFVNSLSGQNGQFCAALLCGGVLLLENNPVMAGMLFGLLCFKPQLAILIPVALAAGGYWRAFIAAGVAALALVAASALLFGEETWIAFAHNAPINALLMEHGDTLWHRMPTVFAMVRLLGGSVVTSYGMQFVSSIAAAILTARFWHSPAAIGKKGAVLVLATFLTTPYAWDYDLVALTFVAAWLAADGLRNGFQPWEKSMLALLLTMPLALSPIAAATHFQIGPLVLWVMLLLTARSAPIRRQKPAVSDPGGLI